MSTVTSQDGTTIAYTRTGSGPAVILVDGAMCHRGFGPAEPLAAELAGHFTVYTYDRRGRGESGDTEPFSIAREVEDIDALIKEAGGSAHVYGISSGAALALEAANAGLAITKLAVYEFPLVVDDTRPPVPADYTERLEKAIATGRPGDAIKTFMREGVRVPAPVVFMMRFMPAWPKLKKTAPTLRYDAALFDGLHDGTPLPEGRWSGVSVPTLVMDGGKSPAWIRNGVAALTKAVPGAEHKTIEGQTHMLKPKAVAPVLIEYFTE
ncbi:alpha/beta fold hydrolase [Amycolatopsis pittospori]|uniref:alpha/beta fold hydrolase n=1 Tax=Amycolatopsis pittospori TaxID=2749434 RepID=UPI0015F09239|nr:alpha/beta hydrolase [Amycolatopsis pittospori]